MSIASILLDESGNRSSSEQWNELEIHVFYATVNQTILEQGPYTKLMSDTNLVSRQSCVPNIHVPDYWSLSIIDALHGWA